MVMEKVGCFCSILLFKINIHKAQSCNMFNHAASVILCHIRPAMCLNDDIFKFNDKQGIFGDVIEVGCLRHNISQRTERRLINALCSCHEKDFNSAAAACAEGRWQKRLCTADLLSEVEILCQTLHLGG